MKPEDQRTGKPKELPEGYSARALRREDLDAVVELMSACEIADEGDAEVSRDDVLGGWERARFSLADDAWLVEAPDGSHAAYGEVWPREDYSNVEGDGYVHPEHRGRGIGRWLVRTMERRAADLAGNSGPGTKTLLRSTVFAGTRGACDLFESEGFTPGRHFWRMVIDLREPVPPPRWPDGIIVRTFAPGDEAEVHAVVQDAFSDNFRHVPSGLSDWRSAMMARESFDPTQWFLAVHEGRIIGVALCPDYPDEGWVRQLAVVREWRRRGIGAALLRHAFAELAGRGKPHAGLVVDSYNRSGAQEFYIAVGMMVEREHQEYEKVVSG